MPWPQIRTRAGTSGITLSLEGKIMDLQLKGKLALVTGSTAGIGLAIATTLAREGAGVIVNGRSRASVDDVVASLKSSTGGDLHGFAGDLSVASSAEQLVREHPGVQI